MQPAIWGPPLWRLMTDVAYKADRVQDTRVLKYVGVFFRSLAFLLPCKYCRHSYRQYVVQLDVRKYAQERRLVQWVWHIKEMVNDKLGRPDSARIDLPTFERRVNTCTHCAQPADVFDFLSILGLNYDASDRLKKKYMRIFHSVLPVVFPYPPLTAILDKYPLTDVSTQQIYLDWLYHVRSAYHTANNLAPLPPPAELWRRYENVRAQAREPVRCQYVLDDPTTWTSQHAAKCKGRLLVVDK